MGTEYSSILFLNAQSISPHAKSPCKWKIPYISENLLTTGSNIPILGITETWLKSYISDAQISIENYLPFRSDRSDRKGGGAILYIHESIPVTQESNFDDKVCQAVLCTLPTITTILINVYRPPDASLSSFTKLLRVIQSYIDPIMEAKYHDINIIGDFNFPNIDWNTLTCTPSQGREQYDSAESLLEFMQHNLLLQVVDRPTRGQNTLDLFFTNNNRVIRNIETENTTLSDHDLVKINLLYNMKSPPTPSAPHFKEHTFRSLDLQKADYPKINDLLSDVNWDELFHLCDHDTDGNSFVELLYLTVLQACEIYSSPKISPQFNSSSSRKPKTDHSRKRFVLNRKRRKLSARLKALKAINPSSTKIPKIEDEVSLLHFDIKETYITEQAHREKLAVTKVLSNPKYFFSFAQRFSKLRSNVGPLIKNGSLTNNPLDMANILQDQYKSVFSDPNNPEKSFTCKPRTSTRIGDMDFSQTDIEDAIDEIDANSSTTDYDIPALVLKECKANLSYPIYIIWQKSFDDELIPSNLKTQIITPIFKKGDKSDAENYRPISLTSHIIKIFERVIRKGLVNHLESNNLLSRNQHGFRKGRSCLTHLLKHIDSIIQSVLDGNEHDVVYLDFAKAFDKVDHKILFHKLQMFGIEGKLLSWIQQFLLNRNQKVSVMGVHSFIALVLSGVPQGSVLGPILFLIYIDDLEHCLTASTSGSFADDTRLSKTISCCRDKNILQEDLNLVIEWSKKNNMKLHESKFELLTYTTPKSYLLQHLPFTAELQQYTTSSGQDIIPSPHVKDLGVHLSSNLKWSTHVSEAVSSANKMSNWVLSVFSDRSQRTMLTLYKSLVRSKLEYSCPVWSPSLISDITKLESTQRSFTRHIVGCKGLSYWDRLKFLNLMSLQRRRERYKIIHVWKIHKGIAPNDLSLRFYEHIRLGTRCCVPPLRKSAPSYAKSIYENSFAVTGPKLWNILPRSVTCAQSLESFKSLLTSHIMSTYPDLPPVHGHSSPNSNSLLDWSTGGLQQMV